jgi:hypothetical protein
MNVLRVICCEFAGSTCHVCAFKYINFIIKGLKSVYGMQKLDIGLSNASLCSLFLVNDCIPMDLYYIGINLKMTCLPISTRLLQLQLFFLNEMVSGFTTLNSQQARKRIRTNRADDATNFKAKRTALASALKHLVCDS